MNVLYVLRRPEDSTAYASIAAHKRAGDGSSGKGAGGKGEAAGRAAGAPTVLLLQDAVYAELPDRDDLQVFYSREDAQVRGASPPGRALEWGEIVDLLFALDRVLGW